nr:hypothetical protein [Streptomyces sp. SLBN-118]
MPDSLATRPAWCALMDLPARLIPGVRTHGMAGAGRREYYGAQDLLPVTAARAAFQGTDLGLLAPVEPAVRFGFGSAPRKPAVVRIITTVVLEGKAGSDTVKAAVNRGRASTVHRPTGTWPG